MIARRFHGWNSWQRWGRVDAAPPRADGTAAAARLLAGSLATATAALVLGPAVPAASADSCPNAALRVGPSADLPECRAYEQVTPADKEASNDMFLNRDASASRTFGMAANRGGSVLLQTLAAFGPSPDGLAGIYVFSRSQGGWRFTPVQPPDAGSTHYSLSTPAQGVFSPDLSRVAPVSFTGSPVTTSPTTPIALAFGAPGGPYTTIATIALGDVPHFAAATPDFGHIFFRARDHSLVPDAADQVAGSDAIYEWIDGELRLVNRMTDGSLTSPCGGTLGGRHTRGGAGGAGVPLKSQGSSHNAVSSDGSRVFFVSPDWQPASSDPSCDEPQRLYMRVNGSETVHVSEPDPGVSDPDGFQPVWFAGAAADGSRVFFVTETQLTADNPTHEHPELYEYHVPSGDLTRVSRGESGDAEGDVQWALPSEDGSTVYFAARGQLAPGAPVPEPGEAGEANLYRYDTATGTTRYIVTLPVRAGTACCDSNSNWYTTPDGRVLVFSSSGDLTGYDPGLCTNPNHSGAGECRELYRYDSGDGSVTCVSCPATSPAFDDAEFTGSQHGPNWPDIRPPRPISDDGARVFFDTPERLLPGDANGNRRDVYMWHDGELSLISSGTDAIDAQFVDSSADGRDVFFGTHARLAATDTDFMGDLYDARVGGGFPPPPGAAACSGEDCKPPPSSPPPEGAAGTREGRGDQGADESRARCERLDQRAKKAQRKAKRLRRKARRASGEQAKRLKKGAKRARKRSKRLKARANRCERRLERG